MKVSFILNKAKQKASDVGMIIHPNNSPLTIELDNILGNNSSRSFEVIIRETFIKEENEETNSKEKT